MESEVYFFIAVIIGEYFEVEFTPREVGWRVSRKPSVEEVIMEHLELLQAYTFTNGVESSN